NQGKRNVERRGRQNRLLRAILVADNDQIVVGVVRGESPRRPLIGKMPGQIETDLAALGGDVGQGAGGENAGGGEQSESMATHRHNTGTERATPQDAPDIVEK